MFNIWALIDLLIYGERERSRAAAHPTGDEERKVDSGERRVSRDGETGRRGDGERAESCERRAENGELLSYERRVISEVLKTILFLAAALPTAGVFVISAKKETILTTFLNHLYLIKLEDREKVNLFM